MPVDSMANPHSNLKATKSMSEGEKVISSLPLLRRPRPPPKPAHAAVTSVSKSRESDQSSISPATSDASSLFFSKQAGQGANHDGAGQSMDSSGIASLPLQSQPSRDQPLRQKLGDSLLSGVTDLVGYSGDVTVRARYVPLGRKHAGPDDFPLGRVRHASAASRAVETVNSMNTRLGVIQQSQQRETTTAALHGSAAADVGDVDFEDAALLAHNTDVTLADDDLRAEPHEYHRSTAPYRGDTMRTGEDEESDGEEPQRHLILTRLEKPVSSTQNYKRMPGWSGPITFDEERQTKVHALLVQAYDAEVIPRVPRHQLEIEAAAKKLDELQITGSAAFSPAQQPAGKRKAAMSRPKGSQPSTMVSQTRAVFRDGEGHQFCGQVRSRSPFEDQDQSVALSPAEAAVVQCGGRGGKHLNLKAYFINEHQLPPLDLVANVTYVNLSFNCLQEFPLELYSLQRLQVLSLRNNPLRKLPEDLWRISTLQALCVSYCMLREIPMSMCSKMRLRDLDVSYNILTDLPENLGMMKSLQTLLVAGNKLKAMPLSSEKLNLKDLRCTDNLFHPLFWLESEGNRPQMLSVLCKLRARQSGTATDLSKVNGDRQEMCHQCHEMLLDAGLNLIRATRPRMHHVAKLPFLYRVCSIHCYQELSIYLDKAYAESSRD